MTTLYNFKQFLENMVLEELHPELQAIIKDPKPYASKKAALVYTMASITKRGEKTGVEGKMPAGSSRAYIQHADLHHTIIDGKPAAMKTGTKIAITASSDHFYQKSRHYAENGRQSLGQMQNQVENGDHFANQHYRTLRPSEDGKSFTTNHGSGIFPPLIEHDHENHDWSHVGHASTVSPSQFKQITRCDTHPTGISHGEFCTALERNWDRNHAKYHNYSPEVERQRDHIESHPLVQKFLDHQGNFNAPPHDYRQIKNMGVWEHPHTGEKHIVARDSGYNNHVMEAYKALRGVQLAKSFR